MNQTNESGAGQPNPEAVRTPRFAYVKQRAPGVVAVKPASVPAFVWWGLAGLLVLLGVFYRIDFFEMGTIWVSNEAWGHGFLVPVFAGFFVFLQWDALRRLPQHGSIWGLVLLVFGIGSHVLFLTTGQLHMSALSLLVVCFGLVLFLLGVEHLKLLWLPIGFLVFMIPIPSSLYVRLTTPLQYISATAGTLMLPLFGISAERQGTMVSIFTRGHWEPLNVIEACSGMRTLMMFLALAVALGYTTTRPMAQKVFLAACSVPIAIFCNALRVTVIGLLFATVSRDYAQGDTHIVIGYLVMLGSAACLQLALAWMLDRIFVDVPADKSIAEARA